MSVQPVDRNRDLSPSSLRLYICANPVVKPTTCGLWQCQEAYFKITRRDQQETTSGKYQKGSSYKQIKPYVNLLKFGK